jgi:hypothetical protein
MANLSLPPRGKTGAEVGLGPRGEDDGAILLTTVGKGKGKRGRAADDHAVLVVLGAVARAHELVRGLVPGHDAAKVSAHSVHAEVSKLAILLRGTANVTASEQMHQTRLVNLTVFL